jgi:hypothetical protein
MEDGGRRGAPQRHPGYNDTARYGDGPEVKRPSGDSSAGERVFGNVIRAELLRNVESPPGYSGLGLGDVTSRRAFLRASSAAVTFA